MNQQTVVTRLQYRTLALGLSLAAHLAVGTAVIVHTGAGRPQEDVERPPRVMAVQLLRSENYADSGLALSSPPKTATTKEARAESPPAAVAVPQAEQNEPVFPVPAQAEPHYFPTRELSMRPLVMQDIPPDIRLTGVPAQTVILRLFINEEGGIDKVVTEQSFLPEEAEQEVAGAFSRLRFHPGMLDGVAVKSQMKIEVHLENEETASR